MDLLLQFKEKPQDALNRMDRVSCFLSSFYHIDTPNNFSNTNPQFFFRPKTCQVKQL